MFARFEATTHHLDIAALSAARPTVGWHSFADWAATIDWTQLLTT